MCAQQISYVEAPAPSVMLLRGGRYKPNSIASFKVSIPAPALWKTIIGEVYGICVSRLLDLKPLKFPFFFP